MAYHLPPTTYLPLYLPIWVKGNYAWGRVMLQRAGPKMFFTNLAHPNSTKMYLYLHSTIHHITCLAHDGANITSQPYRHFSSKTILQHTAFMSKVIWHLPFWPFEQITANLSSQNEKLSRPFFKKLSVLVACKWKKVKRGVDKRLERQVTESSEEKDKRTSLLRIGPTNFDSIMFWMTTWRIYKLDRKSKNTLDIYESQGFLDGEWLLVEGCS